MSFDHFNTKLSASTLKILTDNGIKRLRDFNQYTHTEIEKIHGIGKKAIKIIDSELMKQDVQYKDENENPEVSDYISGFEGIVKEKLEELRSIIRKAIPKAQEKIAYGIPTYYYGENLIHFAGFANHIGIYPTAKGIEAFAEAIKEYKTSKGAIQIPLDRTMPTKLIVEMAKYRYKSVIEKRKEY